MSASVPRSMVSVIIPDRILHRLEAEMETTGLALSEQVSLLLAAALRPPQGQPDYDGASWQEVEALAGLGVAGGPSWWPQGVDWTTPEGVAGLAEEAAVEELVQAVDAAGIEAMAARAAADSGLDGEGESLADWILGGGR